MIGKHNMLGLMLAIGAGLATVSCSDATAPGGGLQVFLTPESVRSHDFAGPPPSVRVVNGSQFAVRILSTTPVTELEASPGVWRSLPSIDPDSRYIDLGADIPARTESSGNQLPGAGLRDLRSESPGRYRLRYRYAPLKEAGVDPALTSYQNVYSNAIVVTP